jgi:putative hemolysin
MDATDISYLILVLVFLILSSFFSSSETAYLSLQKVRLEHLVNERVKRARLVAAMVERPEKLLSIVLLGNNIVNTAAAALVTAVALKLWGSTGVFYATLIITVLLLIFGEMMPKTFAARHSERVALLFIRRSSPLPGYSIPSWWP